MSKNSRNNDKSNVEKYLIENLLVKQMINKFMTELTIAYNAVLNKKINCDCLLIKNQI